MTSALRGREGGCPNRDNSTDRLREWDSDKGGGGGGRKSRKFKYGWPLRLYVLSDLRVVR